MSSPKHKLSSADVSSSTSEESGHKSHGPVDDKHFHIKDHELSSPPSIPAVASLSASWSKDDATHSDIEALLKPDVEENVMHAPHSSNSQVNDKVSSIHVLEQVVSIVCTS